jgi:hypothetical protein
MTALDDLHRGRPLRGDEVPIAFHPHAVERFAERFRDGTPIDEVRRQLSLMLAGMTIVRDLPESYGVRKERREHLAFALEGAAFFPLIRQANGEWLTPTCLSPTMVTEDHLERSRGAKRSQRIRKTTAKKAAKRGRPQPNSRPRQRRWEADE